MKLTNLQISNFKSLKSININFNNFNVLVGPNGSGKSNFTNALDFLSDVYSNGLEMAITRHGGYENIAFRHAKRTKSDIKFSITAVIPQKDKLFPKYNLRNKNISNHDLYICHKFSFRTNHESIKANYQVHYEDISVAIDDSNNTIFDIKKEDNKSIEWKFGEHTNPKDYSDTIIDETLLKYFKEKRQLDTSAQNLMFTELQMYSIVFSIFRNHMSNLCVLQISAQNARNPGVPMLNPKISKHGDNLPAVIDWIKNKQDSSWQNIISGMKNVLPTLEDISIDYLHTKTLGIFFKEEGVNRPWAAEDVSDGTIQSLALLAAIYNQRNSMIIIEELENSIHPWIIRYFIDSLRKISLEKSIILTTHSPVLIDMLNPKELFIVSNKHGATEIKPIEEYYPNIAEDFNNGKIRLSEYLDMGLIPQAIPGGVL